MVHQFQCHAILTISLSNFIHNLNISITNSLQYHNVIHNYSILSLKLTIHNIKLNISFSFHSQFSQKHSHNSVPIYLSHYPRTTTTTNQDNIIYVYVYKMCHSPLYENNPVSKAPNSLFCIKNTFSKIIYIYRGWERILKIPTNITLNVIVRLSVITCRPLAIYTIPQPFVIDATRAYLQPLLSKNIEKMIN